MAEGEESHTVMLFVYDLSQGLAQQLSTTLLGKAIEGIWHTSVNVYGQEYFYSGGIVKTPPNQTPYGRPLKVFELGKTQVPQEVFEEFLKEISPRYTAQTYSLLKHNCNNFSNEVSQFLVGCEIPQYILRLPEEVMASPMGTLLLPMIEQLETTLRYGGVPQMPQAAASLPPNVQAPMLSALASSRPEASNAPVVEATKNAVATSMKSSTEGSSGTHHQSAQNKNSNMDDAKAKVHEEISREFAALMASGGLRASEAAALAARRVMQRHGIGGTGVTSPQS